MKYKYEIINKITLHCNEGTSDKLYCIQVVKNTETGEYELHSQWGRRGKAMRSNPVKKYSTEYSVTYEYNALKHSKMYRAVKPYKKYETDVLPAFLMNTKIEGVTISKKVAEKDFWAEFDKPRVSGLALFLEA